MDFEYDPKLGRCFSVRNLENGCRSSCHQGQLNDPKIDKGSTTLLIGRQSVTFFIKIFDIERFVGSLL